MEAFIVLIVLAAICWLIFVQVAARKQLDADVGISEQEAAQVTMSYFGALWTQEQGPGHLNYQPRIRSWGPTISVTFEPDGTTRCAVHVWVSGFYTRYGLMRNAQLVWRKKQGLIRRLISSGGRPPPLTRGA